MSELMLIQHVPRIPAGHTVAFGDDCMWWGSISEATVRQTYDAYDALYCPHCGGRCHTTETEETFLSVAHRFELLGFPHHHALMRWCRGKCFTSRGDALHAFVLAGLL